MYHCIIHSNNIVEGNINFEIKKKEKKRLLINMEHFGM